MSTATPLTTRTVWPELLQLVRQRMPDDADLDLDGFLRRRGVEMRYILGATLARLDPDTTPIREQLRERLLEPNEDFDHFDQIIEVGHGFEFDPEDYTRPDDFRQYAITVIEQLRQGSQVSHDGLMGVKCLLAGHPLGIPAMNRVLCPVAQDLQGDFKGAYQRGIRFFLVDRSGRVLGWEPKYGAAIMPLSIHDSATLWWIGRHVFDETFVGKWRQYDFPGDERVQRWIEEKTRPIIETPEHKALGEDLRAIFQLRAEEVGRMEKAATRQGRPESTSPMSKPWQGLVKIVAAETWKSTLAWDDRSHRRHKQARTAPAARILGTACADALLEEFGHIERISKARGESAVFGLFTIPDAQHITHKEAVVQGLRQAAPFPDTRSIARAYADVAPVRETLRLMTHLWEKRVYFR